MARIGGSGLLVRNDGWERYGPGLGGGQRLGQPKLGGVGCEEDTRLAGHYMFGWDAVSQRLRSSSFHRSSELPQLNWQIELRACVPRRSAVVPARWAIIVWAGGRGRIRNRAWCRGNARFEVDDVGLAKLRIGTQPRQVGIASALRWPMGAETIRSLAWLASTPCGKEST